MGLDEVKGKIDKLVASAEIQHRRRAEGKPTPKRDMNLLFAGPPGTGKTTVAETIGGLYHALGLVPEDKVIPITGDDLKSEFKGGSAKKAKEVFERAKGGVLFVDEAYALKSGQDDNYGDEAIAAMLPLLEDPNTVVIFGGYKDDLDKLVASNSGLRSRFSQTLEFKPYDRKERAQIFTNLMKKNEYKLGKGVRTAIEDAVMLTGDGNARDVTQLANRVWEAQEARVMASGGDVDEITVEDVTEGALEYQMTAYVDNPLIDALER